MLVGYFRTSGFYLMYPTMRNVEKIRIAVGLNADGKTLEIIQRAENEQMSFEMSHKEVKDEFSDDIIDEMESSQDTYDVEKGIKAFIDWLQSGKMELRIYPDVPIYAKVYIMRWYKC